MTKPRGFPNVATSAFVVAFADMRTGVILKLDGTIAAGDSSAFVVFDDLKSARRFAEACTAQQPRWEGHVFAATGDIVASFFPRDP